jgi:hypothetical protein
MNDVKNMNLRVRTETRQRMERFAARRRLKLVEVAEIAIAALESLPKDEQDALIERRDVEKDEPAAAVA